MATEMFDPDDDAGNLRDKMLLKMIQYMKKYNLNIEIIKRGTKNISKQKGGAAKAPEVVLTQSGSSQSVRRTAAKSTAMDRNHALPITPDSPTSDCSMHSRAKSPTMEPTSKAKPPEKPFLPSAPKESRKDWEQRRRKEAEDRPLLTQSEVEAGDELMKAWNDAHDQHEVNI